MRVLALVAAITIMHTAYALPASNPDLADRRGVNDLSNDKHIFHHLDRNQRTANRDRNSVHGDNGEGPELHVVRRLPNRPQRGKPSEVARSGERVMGRRFVQGPDYSQGGSGSGSDGIDSAPNTTPTPQPQPQANTEKTGDTASRQGRSLR